MTFWLLDDGPLGDLAIHYDPVWTWPAETLHVVREVADGAKFDHSGRRQKLLAMRTTAGPAIQVHTSATAAANDFLFAYLRRASSEPVKDLGEDVSIALAATELPLAVFVTSDRRAAKVALAELGPGRVVTPFDLWKGLLDAKLVTSTQCTSLCDRTRKTSEFPGVPQRLFP